MRFIADHPVLLFAFTVVVLWTSARCGLLVRKRYPLDEEARQDFSVLLGAVLTLLGLIIGFTFSMAAGRYDQRKDLEEAEANAIGTEYLRVAVLPTADAAKVRLLLVSYLDLRIQFYLSGGGGPLGQVQARTLERQDELWSALLGPAEAAPNPIVALAVSGMNDVLNSQGYTQAAWWNRIPRSAWSMIVIIAVCCSFLFGYGSRSATAARKLLHVFPVFIAMAIAFIADIDAPRHGMILVPPRNLISLAESLRAH